MLQKVYQIYGYINVDIIIYDRKEAAEMKKLVKRSDVMQETLEAYCTCSCTCAGTCKCTIGQVNNTSSLQQARYTQFYMDFNVIYMV